MTFNARLNRLYDLGFEYESKYGNCAQCTIAALMDVFNLNYDDLFKVATAFSGGTAGMGKGNCGAYSGGVLALGLKYGRERKDFSDKEKTKKASQLARKLNAKFMEEYGGCSCHDVQMKIFGRTFDLQNPEDRKEFENAGAHIDKCTKVVAKSAQWTGEIILNAESKDTSTS